MYLLLGDLGVQVSAFQNSPLEKQGIRVQSILHQDPGLSIGSTDDVHPKHSGSLMNRKMRNRA